MSETRPSTARKVTRKTVEKQDAELQRGLRVSHGGVDYVVHLGDVTPAIARELRAKIGVGFMALMSNLAAEPDIDLVSAFVWVARRVNGENIPFESVSVTYADLFSEGFDIDLAGEVEDTPEA